jgi:murein DD-endopeptidase MepM/ murein hydrolase activator NlpD
MYQYGQISGNGTAALSFGNVAVRPIARRSFGTREQRGLLRDLDLVVDLGSRIGSGEWFRGLATCAALCYSAYSLAPGFDPLPAAAAPTLAPSLAEEAKAFSIAPLAYGADTGRRMAASESVEPLLDSPERPSIDLIATIGEGDGFVRALERAGVAQAEARQAAGLIGGAVPIDEIKPGTAIDITLGRRSDRLLARPLDSLSLRARFDLKLSLVRAGGGFRLDRSAIAVDATPMRIQGLVGTSLYHAARTAGVPAKVVESYIKAIAGQIDVGELSPGDRFDIIVEQRRAATGETEIGKLLFAGLDRSGGKDLRLMPWDQGGREQWFEASGVGKASGLLQRPVPGAVSSNFGMRFHPILGYFRMHKGEDFRAAAGTPILAATDGTVAAAGRAGGYGNQVRLAHAGGLMTSYSHMSRITAQVGAVVRQGEVIGYVGSTGLATGPHLHYEIYRNGVQVDPGSIKFVMRSQLSGTELGAFRSRLRSLLSVPIGGAARIGTAMSGKEKPSA